MRSSGGGDDQHCWMEADGNQICNAWTEVHPCVIGSYPRLTCESPRRNLLAFSAGFWQLECAVLGLPSNAYHDFEFKKFITKGYENLQSSPMIEVHFADWYSIAGQKRPTENFKSYGEWIQLYQTKCKSFLMSRLQIFDWPKYRLKQKISIITTDNK